MDDYETLTKNAKNYISVIDIFRAPNTAENEEYNDYLDDLILNEVESQTDSLSSFGGKNRSPRTTK